MEINKKAFRNLFIAIAACIVLYWMLHDSDRVRGIWNTVSGMFSPFVLGAAVAFILNVPMRGIEGILKGIKNISLRRTIALVLAIIVFVLVVALVFWLLIPQIGQTIQSLIPKMSTFFINLGSNIQSFLNENPKLMEYVMQYTDLEKFDWAALIEKAMSFLGDSVSTIANGAFSAIGSVTGAIVDAVIGIVFAIYCLYRKEILSRQGRRILYSFLPEHVCDEIIRILRLANSTFSNFLSGQCVEVLILGCMFAIFMAIFRMPYIPLVSVLVAVTAFIPVVGAFVGCIFGAFFIFVNNPIQAIWFVVMFLILQQIENNVIYPRVVGTSIGLPGMWVLVAVTVGGDMMGVGGMFLMIPFASVLYTLMREITDRRLNARGIDPEKLQDHLPELTSKFKKKRENARKKASEEKSETENEAE